MFHSRDSPRLLVCDTGLYLEENDIGFITVAICGGYISKYLRLVINKPMKYMGQNKFNGLYTNTDKLEQHILHDRYT